jgi:hypothetical protein
LRIFVDTSAFYAIEDSSDKNHEKAMSILNDMTEGKMKVTRLYTSNYVFDEALTLLRTQLSHEAAVSWGERIRKSKVIAVLRIDEKDEEEAWRIFRTFKDKDFSFTDCTSFALVKREAIAVSFTFDEHFRQYGLKTTP